MLGALGASALLVACAGDNVDAAPATVAAAPASAIEAPAAETLALATFGVAGGSLTVGDAGERIAGARVVVPAGGGPVTLAISSPREEAPPLFSDLPIMRVESAAGTRLTITLPYTDQFLAEYGARDESVLSLYRRDGGELWAWTESRIDAEQNALTADVDGPGTWVVAPAWMLKAWQPRQIIGGELTRGARNVLVIHGWNASPWEACQLALMQSLSSRYDHVAAYAYPSALDINESARWLRDEIIRRYPGVIFDIAGFSEGGLLARAAIESGPWNGGMTIASQVARLVTIATPHFGLIPGLDPSVLGDVAAEQMRPESAFLRDLNAAPRPSSTSYASIAGNAADGGRSDGLVGVESALGRGIVDASAAVTLPLLHASTYGGGTGMPCDASVYRAIANVR